MELELLLWIGRRLWMRPWVGATWLLLLTSSLLVPLLSNLSIRSEPVYSQAITHEAVFLWGLVGGWIGLGSLAQLGSNLDRMPAGRRWRVRGFTLFISQWLPAFPIWAFGALFSSGEGLGDDLGALALVLTQLSLLALVVDSQSSGILRSLLFAGLAWWVPALVPQIPIGPGPILHLAGTAHAFPPLFGGASPESAMWQACISSMLALALGAVALECVRRPAR